MAATKNEDLVSDTETDVTYCPALEKFSQVKRTQPQRNAKRDPCTMCIQQETVPLHVRKRLHDITCLLKDHLSGKNKVTAHQAKILLLELKKTRKNCTTLGRKITKELSQNCKHFRDILANRGAKDLPKSVENKNSQFNATDLTLADENLLFSSGIDHLCPALKLEITNYLDKENCQNVGNSPNITRTSRHLKENFQSLAELPDLSLNKTPRVYVKSSATLRYYNEKVYETCVQSQNELNSLKSLELEYEQSPTNKKRFVNPKEKAQIQSTSGELFYENHTCEIMNKRQEAFNIVITPPKSTCVNSMEDIALMTIPAVKGTPNRTNEEREITDTFVISPACNNKLLSEAIVNTEKSGNLLAQTQTKEKEIQITNSQQNSKNIKILETAIEVEDQTVADPLYAKFAEGVNKRNSPLKETKAHRGFLTDLTSTLAASDNKLAIPGIKKFSSTSLLPSYEPEKTFSKAIVQKRCYSWSDMSLDVILKEAEKVVNQSYKVVNSSPRFFEDRCGICEAEFDCPSVEETIFEEHDDLIRRLIDEGLISNVHILKKQKSANMYCLTEKDLVHIAAKINVDFEDLKRVIETVVRSDGDSDESTSIISASQSPTERRYSQSQTESSEEKYK